MQDLTWSGAMFSLRLMVIMHLERGLPWVLTWAGDEGGSIPGEWLWGYFFPDDVESYFGLDEEDWKETMEDLKRADEKEDEAEFAKNEAEFAK